MSELTRDELLADGLMNISEACRFLALGATKLYDLMAKEELPYTIVGGRRKIPRRAVMELAAKCLAVPMVRPERPSEMQKRYEIMDRELRKMGLKE